MKTALRPEKVDERSGNMVITEKYAAFKFILHPYYVFARFSLPASNMFQLISLQRTCSRAHYGPVHSYYVLTTTIQIASRS